MCFRVFCRLEHELCEIKFLTPSLLCCPECAVIRKKIGEMSGLLSVASGLHQCCVLFVDHHDGGYRALSVCEDYCLVVVVILIVLRS